MKKEKNSHPLGAVIDIGSNALRLKIGEAVSGEMRILEHLRYPLSLGRDTFTKGKIGFEKVDQACEIIKGFLKLIEEYKIHTIKAVATSAVREALNKDYILDQMKIKTGLSVHVIDDAKEKLFIYKEMCRSLQKYPRFEGKAAMMVYIGSGSLGISLYQQGNIVFTQNIRIGSLKLSELLGEIQEQTEKFYIVVEEYISNLTRILKTILPAGEIGYFIASGREIEMIANLCEAHSQEGFLTIPKARFQELYQMIKHKTPHQLMQLYKLPEDKAEVLLPSMSIYHGLMKFTEAEQIDAPFVFLSDALLYDILHPKERMVWDEVFEKNTVLTAQNVAKRYQYDANHAEVVERYSLQIFDKMKKIHGLGMRERLLLQIAAILHDIGKYINIKQHYEHSYTIIRSSDIIGLSSEELEIVANIAKYHSRIVPDLEQQSYRRLENTDRVLVSKLSAILRVADALDRSHHQKLQDMEVTVKDNKLQIAYTAYKDTMLEEWSFNQKGELFEEVFGMKAQMKKKRVI